MRSGCRANMAACRLRRARALLASPNQWCSLIRLKHQSKLKASGMSAPYRLRNLADVQDLIGVLGLPLEFADKLDESVRDESRRLWQMVQAGH
jgi:hypothetical protein